MTTPKPPVIGQIRSFADVQRALENIRSWIAAGGTVTPTQTFVQSSGGASGQQPDIIQIEVFT